MRGRTEQWKAAAGSGKNAGPACTNSGLISSAVEKDRSPRRSGTNGAYRSEIFHSKDYRAAAARKKHYRFWLQALAALNSDEPKGGGRRSARGRDRGTAKCAGEIKTSRADESRL